MSTHKQEVEAVRTLVASLGGDFTLTHQGGLVRGTAGAPDCYIRLLPNGRVRYGLRFHLEVKVGRDKLSPSQAEWKRIEEALGGVVIVGGAMEVIAHINPYLTTPIKVI